MSERRGASPAKIGNSFSTHLVSLMTARKILGSRRVYAGTRVAKTWKTEFSVDLPIRYSKADLVEAARENAMDKTDWRLVRILGQWTYGGLYTRITVVTGGKSLWPKTTIGRGSSDGEDKWMMLRWKPIPGYYLIDFAGKWGSTSWHNQEAQITASGADFERVDEVALTEAVFSIFLLTGEQPLKKTLHWGSKRVSGHGYRTVFGFSVVLGEISGYSYWVRPRYDNDDNLRVVRSRKLRS